MGEAVTAEVQRDRLLDVVVEILETEGYDAVQLREVARRAKASLATIYKRCPTRDDLILAALEYWSQQHRYAGIGVRERRPGASLYDALMELFRTIFEPWDDLQRGVWVAGQVLGGGDRCHRHPAHPGPDGVLGDSRLRVR